MKRFTIITPTIGRRALVRSIRSVCCQTKPNGELWTQDVRHIVVGDGPLNPLVRTVCEQSGVTYDELPIKKGCHGSYSRNFALRLIESAYPTQYILFLDDDNFLLPNTFTKMDETARRFGDPPVLVMDIWYWHRHIDDWWILPDKKVPPEQGYWDFLCGAYRSDVIRGKVIQEPGWHDYLLANEVETQYGKNAFVKVDHIGGVHYNTDSAKGLDHPIWDELL